MADRNTSLLRAMGAFWIVALSSAAFTLARFGFYDYRDKWWYDVLVWSPAVVLLSLVGAAIAGRRLWSGIRGWKLVLVLLTQAIVIAGCLYKLTTYFSKGRDVTLNVCNATPFDLTLALRYQANRLESRIAGYWTLAPSACEPIKVNALRVKPQLSIFAASKENVERWFKTTESRMDFDKYEILDWTRGATGDPRPVRENAPWEKASTICVAPARSAANETPGRLGRALKATVDFLRYRPPAFSRVDCDGQANEHQAPFAEAPYDFAKGDQYEISISRAGRNVALRVCNLVPAYSSVALHYQSKRAEWKTDALELIPAGECRSLERNFQRVEPAFYMHTVSEERQTWPNLGLPDEIRTQTTDMIKGDVMACLGEKDRTANAIEDVVNRCGPGETLRPFLQADAYQCSERNPGIECIRAQFVPRPMDKSLEFEQTEMKLLKEQLSRRVLHRIRFPRGESKPIPYSIGLSIFRENRPQDCQPLNASGGTVCSGEYFRGVVVAGAMTTTPAPFFAKVAVVPGDEIVAFDGQPIFSIEDLYSALIDFAESKEKGIMKPYAITVRRMGIDITVPGFFFFNPEAFKNFEYSDRQKAAEWGSYWSILNVFGKPVERYCSHHPEERDCLWSKTQEFWRLKQMYAKDYDRANFRMSVIQGLATVVAGGWLARGARWLLGLEEAGGAVFTTEALAGAGLGAAEFATLRANDVPPNGDIHKEVRDAAKLGAAFGFAGVLLSPTRAAKVASKAIR